MLELMEGIGISKDGGEINNDKSKEVKDRVDKILNPDSKVPAVKSVDEDNVDQPNASNETPLAQGDLGKSIVKDIDVDEQLDAESKPLLFLPLKSLLTSKV